MSNAALCCECGEPCDGGDEICQECRCLATDEITVEELVSLMDIDIEDVGDYWV